MIYVGYRRDLTRTIAKKMLNNKEDSKNVKPTKVSTTESKVQNNEELNIYNTDPNSNSLFSKGRIKQKRTRTPSY